MEVSNDKILQEEAIIRNLEYQIKNNEFTDKEQLFNYMLELRTSGISKLDSNKIRELLQLFDSLSDTQESIKTSDIANQPINEPIKYKPKTKVRKREFCGNTGNAAFTKVGLLIINIITFTLLIAMIILLNK